MIVQYTLKTTNIWDSEARYVELVNIREWLEELVNWEEDKFQIKFHSQGQKITIWFDDERHATMFMLRWV